MLYVLLLFKFDNKIDLYDYEYEFDVWWLFVFILHSIFNFFSTIY